MSYTTFGDQRLMRRFMLEHDDLFDRTLDLARGVMAWDGSDNNGREPWEFASAANWLTRILRNEGFVLAFDGPSATVRAPFEYSLTAADKETIKRQALGRRGLIYRLEQVAEHKKIPIFKVDIYGHMSLISGACNINGFYRDVYICGRSDVLMIRDRRNGFDGLPLKRCYNEFMWRDLTYGKRLDAPARPTLLKARHTARNLHWHIDKFDAVVAADRERKAVRLAKKPWAPKFMEAGTEADIFAEFE